MFETNQMVYDEWRLKQSLWFMMEIDLQLDESTSISVGHHISLELITKNRISRLCWVLLKHTPA